MNNIGGSIQLCGHGRRGVVVVVVVVVLADGSPRDVSAFPPNCVSGFPAKTPTLTKE